jgi:hypothetical protein
MTITFKCLQEKKKEMAEELDQARIKLLQPYEGKTIFGFKIYLEKNEKNGKVYRFLRAYRNVKGLTANVYIGQDPNQIEDKIRAYLEKKPLYRPEDYGDNAGK